MSMIELGHHEGREISGAVIDLVKCFNLLPRMPVLMMLKQFQVPGPILRAWSSALVSMQRRFKLRNCTGPGILSTTGFAEGLRFVSDSHAGSELGCTQMDGTTFS